MHAVPKISTPQIHPFPKVTIPQALNYQRKTTEEVFKPSREPIEDRINRIHLSFVNVSTAALTAIENIQVIDSFQENSKLVLLNLLSQQVIQYAALSNYDLAKKLRDKVNFAKESFAKILDLKDMAVYPPLSYGLTGGGAHLKTLKPCDLDKEDSPRKVDVPRDLDEALAFLEKTSAASDRLKAQILLKFYEKEINAECKAKSHIAEQEDDIAKDKERKIIAECETRCRKIEQKVDKILPFQRKKKCYQLFTDMIFRDDKNMLALINPLFDAYGLIRMELLLQTVRPDMTENEKKEMSVKIADKFADLLESHLRKELPKEKKIQNILQSWTAHFIMDANHFGKNLNTRTLALALRSLIKKYNPNEENRYLCLEFLLILSNPDGVEAARYFGINKKNKSIAAICRAFGITDLIYSKHKHILHRKEPLLQVSDTLKGAFLNELRQPTSCEEGTTILYFDTDVLPTMQSGKLTRAIREEIATELYKHSARMFAGIPPNVFYNGSWKKCDQMNLLPKEGSRLGQWALSKVLEGDTIEKRAHTLGQFLPIIKTLLDKGETCFSLYFYNAIYSNEVLFKEEWAYIKEKNSPYKSTFIKLQNTMNPDGHYKALKNHMNQLQKKGLLIIPLPGFYTQQMEPAIKHEGNPYDALVLADQLLRYQFAIRYWLVSEVGQVSSQKTNLIDEANKLEVMDNYLLPEFIKAKRSNRLNPDDKPKTDRDLLAEAKDAAAQKRERIANMSKLVLSSAAPETSKQPGISQSVHAEAKEVVVEKSDEEGIVKTEDSNEAE